MLAALYENGRQGFFKAALRTVGGFTANQGQARNGGRPDCRLLQMPQQKQFQFLIDGRRLFTLLFLQDAPAFSLVSFHFHTPFPSRRPAVTDVFL